MTKRHSIILLLIGLALAGGAYWLFLRQDGLAQEPYAIFRSPSGDYRLEVYARAQNKQVVPGQSGDVPGMVFLLDRDGRIVRHTEVEMVQLVQNPVWDEGHVSVKLLFDWSY